MWKILFKNILALYRYRDFRVGIFYFASPCINERYPGAGHILHPIIITAGINYIGHHASWLWARTRVRRRHIRWMLWNLAFYRTMLCIARTTLSQDVCPSVRLSQPGILSKRLDMSSYCFHCRLATPF